MTTLAWGNYPHKRSQAMHTDEGHRRLEEFVQDQSNHMTAERAKAFLAKTGMYNKDGQLKEEFR